MAEKETARPKDTKDKVQGEGDYEAARRFRKDSEEYMKKGDVGTAAEEAKESYEGEEREELERAEKAGHDRAKEFDPQVKRK